MRAPLRLGVIGLGFMGTKWARAFREHGEVELAVVCDVLEERARQAAEHLDTAWSADPAATAGDRTLHGLAVCTPEHLHTDAAVAAIEAGTPVAVEKPLAHELVAAERIRDTARRAGVPVLTAHILRFEPRYAALKTAVDDGTVGQVRAVRSERIGVVGDQRVLRGRTSVPLYYGSHEFDLARWYAGEVTSVAARRNSGVLRAAGYDVDDLYSVVLGFENGAHGTSMLGWSLPDATAPSGTSGFTVIGDNGFARVEQEATGLSVVTGGGRMGVDSWYAPGVCGRTTGALANQVDHFVRVARGEVEPLCTATDGTQALRISLAAELAAAREAIVSPQDVSAPAQVMS